MQFSQENLTSIRRIFMPVLVFAIAAVVYSQYGFHGLLLRDNAACLYSGQRMAHGVPPYVSIHLIKGPIAPMFAGLGVIISKQLVWDDILTVRLVFFFLSCLVVLSVYLLAHSLFRSQRTGVFAALAFLGFFNFTKHAASGPRPKTPMVLFETLSLLLTSRRKWFWAGVCGSLALLTWQPAASFALATLVLAATQPSEKRLAAILRTLCGIGLPVVVIGAYFHIYGALDEFLNAALLFGVRYLDKGPYSFISQITRVEIALWSGYRTMALAILVGFAMLLYFYPWRKSLHRSWRDTLTKDAFAPLLLTFPPVVLWPLRDFQGPPDLYVFLPFVAIGFAAFLDLAVQCAQASTGPTVQKGAPRFLAIGLCIGLVALAWINVHRWRESRLDEQIQAAIELEDRFGKDARLLSLNVPEVLVLLHRTNPTPYVLIMGGRDRLIHAETPGGFDGWLQELEAYAPDVITFRNASGIHLDKLRHWLNSSYHQEQIGPWTVFVRDSAGD